MKPVTIWVWQSATEPKDYFWYYSLDAAKRRLLLANGSIREMRVAFALTPNEIEDHVHYELFVRPIEEPEDEDWDAAHEAEFNAKEFPRS